MNWIEPTALYHASETPHIDCFQPRPANDGTDKVWAILGKRLQNYLFPRDCPRICLWANSATTAQDKALLDGAETHITIEEKWRDICARTPLYIYQFAPKDFKVQDENAGYMTSRTAQRPLQMYELKPDELDFNRLNTKLSTTSQLLPLRDKVLGTSLAYSMIRLRNAAPIQSMPL
ncbi:DUF6886 family protein [Maritalea mediterranea]|uniref:DUF4433 domain-containing protein n=1 Tax=Maritalea mediterranea TaxID=2909667 RepID=A0ABS9E9X8_9HYPH|nr:DUF6886 family protein [Maritalea mediterranea]MCF4099568.1 hypothetical protein [Maritalea mediterranea]